MGDIIVATSDEYLYRLRPDGSEIWNYQGPEGSNCLITDSKGNIVSGQNSGFYIYNLNGGDPIWATGGYSINCLALQSDGKILVGHSQGIIRLNIDYSIDETFNIDDWFGGFNVISILVNFDDSFYVGITTIIDHTLFLSNKDLLTSASISTINLTINCLAKDSLGRIYTGTDLGIYRFLNDGSVDENWTVFGNIVKDILIKDTVILQATLGSFVQILDKETGIYIKSFDKNNVGNYYKLISQQDKTVVGYANGLFRELSDFSFEDTTFSSSITSEVHAITLIPIVSIPTLIIRRLLRKWRIKIPRDKKSEGNPGLYDSRIRNKNTIVEFIYGKNPRNTLGDKRIVINDITVTFMV